ncbi:hypothetical protein MNV49_007979 [Pseudohyphozyma bogoriensis]|nr:hypothetical protein MNV49_007979 [Pseudohyphozyma bogoriensis]
MSTAPADKLKLPPNTQQLVLPSSHAVLPNGFTRDVFTSAHHTATPGGELVFEHSAATFVATHASFLDILGDAPSVEVIASSEVSLGGDGRQFAHEAGIWVDETQEVFFTSNLYRPHTNVISKIKVDALETGRTVTSSWDEIQPTPDVVTGNGGILFGSELLICSQGVGVDIPSSLSLVSPHPPYASRQILNNFHGRPFNAINDVVILPPPSASPSEPHPTTDRIDLHGEPHTTIWFTDPTYGYAQGYKPAPLLPNQVYCFNPTTGDVRVVADGFLMPNGIAFDWKGEKCYITDTGVVVGKGDGTFDINAARPATIYVYDVVRPPHGADLTAEGPTLHNRRVFAYTDSGVPDGIKTDRAGNVYSGCGDGVQVWNSSGTLIGKIVMTPSVMPKTVEESKQKEYETRGAANFNFIPGGRMVVYSEDRIYLVKLNPNVQGALLP